MTSTIITADLLLKKCPCEGQLQVFSDLFPNGTPANRADALAAALEHAAVFDWSWAAENLLSATALKAYYKAIAPAYKAHWETVATAHRAYNEARATADKAFNEAIATARKAREEARATAFINAWFDQCEGD